jgi:hypothetical protein
MLMDISHQRGLGRVLLVSIDIRVGDFVHRIVAFVRQHVRKRRKAVVVVLVAVVDDDNPVRRRSQVGSVPQRGAEDNKTDAPHSDANKLETLSALKLIARCATLVIMISLLETAVLAVLPTSFVRNCDSVAMDAEPQYRRCLDHV